MKSIKILFSKEALDLIWSFLWKAYLGVLIICLLSIIFIGIINSWDSPITSVVFDILDILYFTPFLFLESLFDSILPYLYFIFTIFIFYIWWETKITERLNINEYNYIKSKSSPLKVAKEFFTFKKFSKIKTIFHIMLSITILVAMFDSIILILEHHNILSVENKFWNWLNIIYIVPAIYEILCANNRMYGM